MAIAILFLVRRGHLHGPFATWWLLVAAIALLAGLFPSVVDAVARLVGISYPPILAIILALAMILIKMLTMDLARSRQERMIRRLAQRLAILEGRSADNE